MPIYVPGKLTLRQTYIGTDDPDAEAYIAAVEAADEAASPGIGGLETATKAAIHSFVKGCKADGIWNAIKASCVLAGARTLAGALVPLVGAAPTNVNFVSGDYDRETGLVGDGSTKYLDSNRANNADPQDSNHNAVYRTVRSPGHLITTVVGENGGNTFNDNGPLYNIRNRGTDLATTGTAASGFAGINRAASNSVTVRSNGVNVTANLYSQPPSSTNVSIFSTSVPNGYTASRIAFYSIGESLDLALLDTRVTTLINAIGAAIP